MIGKKVIGYLSLSLAASFWGTMLVIGKSVMGQVSPFFVLWVRYLIAFFLLFIFLSIKKEKISKSDLPFMAWLGFVGYFLSNGSSFLGTHLSTAQLGSLFIGTSPVFTMFLATFILKERMTLRKVISILLASAGILIVVGVRTEQIVATALAFLLWNKGMQYVEAGIGSIFIFFQVIAGGLLAWLFLGEELTNRFFIGSILIFVAILIIIYQDKQPSKNRRMKRRGSKEIA